MIVRAETPDDRAAVLDYIAQKIKISSNELVGEMPYELLASTTGVQVLGAVLYINMRGASIEMTCAGEPGWLTKASLREFFSYPFIQLGVRRVTGIVHRKNKRARRLNERLGFKLEGVCRHGFMNGDACIYGMLKRDCRWIKEPKQNG